MSESPDRIAGLIGTARRGESLSREDLTLLLNLADEESLEALGTAADAVRREAVGDAVYLRGIVEFSNFCRQNCLYCGLRRDNRDIIRYRMDEDAVLAAVRRIRDRDIGTVVLQSGEDPAYTRGDLCRIVGRIRNETGLIVTLSVGERPLEDYRAFREAGADRYLLKHETASPDLYRRLRPGCMLEDRLRCLKDLRDLGYEVGTGNMVGLPGQTPEILADDLLLIRSLDADMLGIGPFIPHPGTPLAGAPGGDLKRTLRVLALARLLTRDTNIPATTALGTLHPEGRIRALRAGANIVMPDFTPETLRARYDIYPGKSTVPDGDILMARLREDLVLLERHTGKGPGGRVVPR
ncbi:MAG: [FeFe] hydrogenase H-cluster radical SAM maturase HydE [Syntrophaceae bacterium]|nr:[FeFe] hydrogenase H-cluster radical SAM maturase HydE [Syntrophaceae bacterium]